MLGKLFFGETAPTSADIPLSFKLAGERSLRLSVQSNDEGDNERQALQMWRYLSHHIRRYPLDLRAHVQRILLTQRDTLLDRLEGSLLDLYLALGSAGKTLKAHMLQLSEEWLTEERCYLFREWLEDGVVAKQSAHWFKGSMLATGSHAEGKRLISQQRSDSASRYANVQAEIQDYLEYGQIDLAQTLLEREFLSGRGTPELEQELLTIYRYTRNKTRLNEVTEAMRSAQTEFSEEWIKLLDEAVNW